MQPSIASENVSKDCYIQMFGMLVPKLTAHWKINNKKNKCELRIYKIPESTLQESRAIMILASFFHTSGMTNSYHLLITNI